MSKKLTPEMLEKDDWYIENITSIICPECNSRNIDVSISKIGCDNPVEALIIQCENCAWSITYYHESNCIPITDTLKEKLFASFIESDYQDFLEYLYTILEGVK